MSSCHETFQIGDSGLVISSDYPYLGASPDGIVSCGCCGIGVNEIKCPYCKRDNSINEAVEDKKFCVQSVSGKLALDRTMLIITRCSSNSKYAKKCSIASMVILLSGRKRKFS